MGQILFLFLYCCREKPAESFVSRRRTSNMAVGYLLCLLLVLVLTGLI